jgi:hypothetical protein
LLKKPVEIDDNTHSGILELNTGHKTGAADIKKHWPGKHKAGLFWFGLVCCVRKCYIHAKTTTSETLDLSREIKRKEVATMFAWQRIYSAWTNK